MAGSETAETVDPSGSCRPKQHLPTQAPPAGPADPSVGNRRSVTHCPQCPQGHTPSHHALSANFLDGSIFCTSLNAVQNEKPVLYFKFSLTLPIFEPALNTQADGSSVVYTLPSTGRLWLPQVNDPALSWLFV